MFLDCSFQNGICLFPPKLKLLKITSSPGEFLVIEDLPETLESYECSYFHLKRSMESGFLIPPRLLNLDVARLMDSEGKNEIGRLPLDLPTTLLSLKISNMYSLQALPSLCLGSLKSIELSHCNSLSTLPPFPQSLLKLGIHFCHEIRILNLPNDLEELLCDSCQCLKLDLPKLPPLLQKLSTKHCFRMADVAQLDKLPVRLKDLELVGFDNIASLPSHPSGLHSLVCSKTAASHFFQFFLNLCRDLLLAGFQHCGVWHHFLAI
jgi:hypothetical protein